MIRIYWTVLLLGLVAGSLRAQPFYFKNLQVENGLSNNSVICSLQDKRGFLWFGTKDGLNRFNGYQFKVFRNDSSDAHSLGGNFIHSLNEDSHGQIWVGTDRGLYMFDQTSETFNKLAAAPNEEIRDVKSDQANNLWFIAGLTLYRYERQTGRCVTFPPGKYFQATSICVAEKHIWVSGAAGELYEYNETGQILHKNSVFLPSRPDAARFIERIFKAGQNQLLVSTLKQGIKLFDIRTGACEDIPITNEDHKPIFARDIICAGEDEYWIGSESGIFIYHLQSGKYIHLKKQYNNPLSLSDNAVYTLCRDKEGGIWIGTYFGGINRYAKQYATFEKYFPKTGENSISGNAVREIKEDNMGNMWIGTEDGGLNKMNAKGEFTSYQAFAKSGTIATNNIHGLLITGDTVWVGTFENGLDLLSVSTGRVFKHYDMDDKLAGLQSNFIYQVFRAKNGTIWLATGAGVHTYDFRSRRFERCRGLPDLFYTELYEDSLHHIWAGTYNNGVYEFDPRTNKSKRLWDAKDHKSILTKERINAIYEDSVHAIWFGTERGLYRFDSVQQNVRKYSVQTGFPSDVIYAILPDKYQRLWISTSKGLVCFDPKSGNLQIFSTANGILSDQFNYRSFFVDRSGRFYFGSVKGMIRFVPFVNQEKYTSPNYITGFQIDNQEVALNTPGSPLRKSILLTDTIQLNHTQSSFSIDFASLSFTSSQTTHYRYRLEGLDSRWTTLKSNRRVYFTRLNPGTYQFSFNSANYTGAWSPDSKVLTIIIAPPLWASKWAFFLYALAGVAMIHTGIRNYKKRIENRHRGNIALLKSQQEKEVYESKISFFTTVAHEIRTPLSLIMAPMERVIKAAGNVPAIQFNLTIMEKNANRLLELTNQLLDFRKTEVNGYDLNFVRTDVTELLASIFILFEDTTQERGIDYKMISGTDSFEAYIDREIFSKIIGNLIDNAVKYAKSKISVELLQTLEKPEVFRVLVKNDGALIPQDKREEIFEAFYRLDATRKSVGTGLGLPLSRSLTELHRGKLLLLLPENLMNVFELVLPVHQQIEFNVKPR